MSKIIGIDSCPGGWVVAVSNTDYSSISIHIISNLEELKKLYSQIILIAIDMPVHLKNNERMVDVNARKILGKRASTIFSAPVEEALNTNTYEEASLVNFKITGKKLSKQSHNLFPKIKEVQNFMKQNNEIKIFESHPELAFMALNDGKIIVSKKKTIEGFNQRLNLLKKVFPNFSFLVVRSTIKKSLANDDDILDALVTLGVGIKIYNKKFNSIIEQDHKEMSINY